MSGVVPGAAFQSALLPAGEEAARIASLAWLLIGGATAIFLATAVLLVLALRGRRALATPKLVAIGGVAVPVLVLSGLLVGTFAMGPKRDPAGEPALVVEVVAHQWWWRVRYLAQDGSVAFETANEIRIPTGATIELRLGTADVLHAFWVPALAGKLDMIPGRENRLRVRALRTGEFRGQCAEYCGGPHARMGLLVVAHAPDAYRRWHAAQRAPQRAPSGPGAGTFEARCAVCHVVRGVAERGILGPDLTHFASRRTLGAALLPNRRESIEQWIVANQHLKPGNLMPGFGDLDAGELDALVAWLERLE